MKFIQARFFNRAQRATIDQIVIHDMEYPEIMSAAENVARWFAGPQAPQASAHFCVDNADVIQCVREEDIAWHTPGLNATSLGVEHAGYAKQARAEWMDPYSLAELGVSAKLVAGLCLRWKIPVVWLSADDLKAGKRGITGHKQATDAFRHGVGHWDPGPNFPIAMYLEWVRAASDLSSDPLPVVLELDDADWKES
jgi:N-acetyl-anhydromuramyl-L-alanine amidase AmpD